MSTYFSIRCDGPTCRIEAHRRLSSPELAIPGSWHVLKLDQGKDCQQGGMEDLHFCGVSCLERWAKQDAAQAATVPLATVTGAQAPAVAASANDPEPEAAEAADATIAG